MLSCDTPGASRVHPRDHRQKWLTCRVSPIPNTRRVDVLRTLDLVFNYPGQILEITVSEAEYNYHNGI